jgi:hypothetical protein
MAFKLLAEADSIKGEQTYSVKTFLDNNTNTQRNEYILDGEILFAQEYEFVPMEEPEVNFNIQSTLDGFDIWYDIVGPDWRPTGF